MHLKDWMLHTDKRRLSNGLYFSELSLWRSAATIHYCCPRACARGKDSARSSVRSRVSLEDVAQHPRVQEKEELIAQVAEDEEGVDGVAMATAASSPPEEEARAEMNMIDEPDYHFEASFMGHLFRWVLLAGSRGGRERA